MCGGQPNPTKQSDTNYTGQCVFRVSDEFRVREIGLELGQVHFFTWRVGDEFLGLPIRDGEIQTGNDGGMITERL